MNIYSVGRKTTSLTQTRAIDPIQFACCTLVDFIVVILAKSLHKHQRETFEPPANQGAAKEETLFDFWKDYQ